MTSARSVALEMPAKPIEVPGTKPFGLLRNLLRSSIVHVAALRLHGSGIVEAGLMPTFPADDAPEMRADLVRATLLKRMTGQAFFGGGLAALDVCVGKQGLDRLGRLDRGDLGSGRGLFRHGDFVTRLFHLAGGKNRVGGEV